MHAGAKDTRHGEGLGEGVEGAAPGDLPGSHVNQDEVQLQQELAHLPDRAGLSKKRAGLAGKDERNPTSDLVKDDGHDEEVQQEALGGVRAVKVEKDEREEKSDELEAGVTEGRAQELQSGHGGQQNIAAADKGSR